MSPAGTDAKVRIMLGTDGRGVPRPALWLRLRPPSRRARAAAAARAGAAACVLAIGGAAITGCDQPASAAPAIQVGTASIPQPAVGGTTDAFVVILNKGPADRLISARTSDGGRVTFRGPVSGGSAAMRTVPAIAIPAATTVRLVPDGFHLLITGARPMRGGTSITLTLVFARAGSISVEAQITNPQSGGSSYFRY
jgi:periplasmic copper chaperone A